jgi:hypothetical protein
VRRIPLAHETWFTEQRPPYDWGFATEPATVALVISVVAITLLWRLAAHHVAQPEIPLLRFLGGLVPWMPRLLSVHAGVSLLAQAASGSYLAPGLALPDALAGTLLATLEAIIGVWLIAGYRVRPAALLLVAAGPIGALGYGIVPILERVDLLGIALFLTFLPPDDLRPGGRVAASPGQLQSALIALRFLVGGALVVLAFTEKLARPDLALQFLERFPAFNVLAATGLDVGDLTFVRVAGAVELLFGLLIISGALPQIVVIGAGVPFNATLFFLGATELIGHLPLYGAMLALLVYGSHPATARLVPRFPRVRLGSVPARRAAGARTSRPND